MQYRDIGTYKVKASAIALGTWAIGGGGFWDGEDNESAAIETIQSALSMGVTLIDTAPGYGDGKSETIVGKAIAGIPRDKVVISTKCGLIWWGDEGGYMHTLDGKRYYRNLEPASMRTEVSKSLERMKIDYIDVLFTHWPSLDTFPTPIERTMQGLLDLKAEGLIKAIGASNVSLSQIKEYMAVGQLDAIQPPYSMLNRAVEADILPYCVENNISAFAYSPLEQGLLTGHMTMDYVPPKGTYRADYLTWYKPENRIKVINMLASWKDLQEKYDATVSQLVVAWTIAQKGMTHALCGARKPHHIAENVKAGSIVLSAEDIARMRADVEALGDPA